MNENISLKESNPNFLNKNNLLKETNWQQILYFLNVIGIEVNLNKRTIKNQDYIWYVLNCFQHYFVNKLNHNFRKVMLFYRQLGKNSINTEYKVLFLKLNYIFDNCFFNYKESSLTGLNNFRKRIITTCVTPESFKNEIEYYHKLKYLFEEQIDQQLTANLHYLQEISLPKKEYPRLTKNLNSLLNQSFNPDILLAKKEKTKQLLGSLNQFKNKYIRIYLKKHENYQNKLVEFYQNLSLLPEYNLLLTKKILTEKEKMIKQSLENFFPDICLSEDTREQLKNKPYCRCGFNLQENYFLPSVKKVKPLLKNKINMN